MQDGIWRTSFWFKLLFALKWAEEYLLSLETALDSASPRLAELGRSDRAERVPSGWNYQRWFPLLNWTLRRNSINTGWVQNADVVVVSIGQNLQEALSPRLL